jgi:hypothetical protein
MRRALTPDPVFKRLAVLGTTLATVFFTILAGTAYALTSAKLVRKFQVR